MGDIGDAIGDFRGFLADPLDRFKQVREQQGQSARQSGLGDYIGQSFDPFARLQQTQGGPNSQWGRTIGVNPSLERVEALGSRFHNPFLEDKAIKDAEAAAKAAREGKVPPSTTGSTVTGGTGGGDWTGPATAADNAAITPDKVEQVIAQTRANSPLRGKGAWLLAEANKRNISLPAFMGILLAESELGTTAGPGWNVAGVGGAGNFTGYGSLDEALIGAMDNLASGMYQPLTLEAKIGYWFAGPQKWQQYGLDASDGQNGTVRDYITGKVAPMYQAFGVPFQQAAAPTRQAAPTGGPVFQTLFGGGTPPVMQEFGHTDYSEGHPDTYAYGNAYGLEGSQHPGVDYGIDLGTKLYVPVSGTVTVVGNDHGSGYFYTSPMTNTADRDHSGELAITLANGDIIILGHMGSINLQVGQQVTAGTLAGLSGGSDGAHLHLEVRRKDPTTSSGYRIVDPRSYFGQR